MTSFMVHVILERLKLRAGCARVLWVGCLGINLAISPVFAILWHEGVHLVQPDHPHRHMHQGHHHPHAEASGHHHELPAPSFVPATTVSVKPQVPQHTSWLAIPQEVSFTFISSLRVDESPSFFLIMGPPGSGSIVPRAPPLPRTI